MISKFFKYLFTAIICVVIILPRFYQLGTTPPGLHIDEVSFAADAKSLAQSLRDTHGVFLPRVFEAFGEYKAPGLTYSMAFWSMLTGQMNNFIARLPSALAGIFSIFMLVLTIRTLYPKSSPYLLGFSALLLAYSPWHFDMSRIFYEAFSAMAFMSLSLYLATRQLLLPHKVKTYEWWLLLGAASLAGYYYASIRYVVIIYVLILSSLLSANLTLTISRSIKALLVVFVVGIFWVGDLFSSVGLNRLSYYQQKSAYGATLTIDEKRQFCYLALSRNDTLTKPCYLLWNKPVEKVVGAAKTITTYLGTDYLFLQGESEYGFDSEYGAFLLPLILPYLMGLYTILSLLGSYLKNLLSHKTPTPKEKIALLYAALALVALVPGALALSINMRMAMLTLYILSLIIAIGLVEAFTQLSNLLSSKMITLLLILFGGSFFFFAVQSTVHYYFVFTKSNDLQWTSDAHKIFGYVKSLSPNYDRIVDTELHGPLAPYFYGDITTQEVHAGSYSKPDDIGFFYLIQAGKYELKHINIFDLACEVVSSGDTRRTLVISNPYPELYSTRLYGSYSTNGALLLHEVYDLADVIAYKARSEPNFYTRCAPK